MKLTQLLAVSAALTMTLVGCQTVPYEGQAREVKRKPQQEGVIALPSSPRTEDRAKAEVAMKSNCSPFPAKINEEGEVVVGQEVKSTASENDRQASKTNIGSLFGIPLTSGTEAGKDTHSSSTTTSIKEWQISYTCETKATAKR